MKHVRKGDLWICAGVLGAALLLWLGLVIFARPGYVAVVTVDGAEVAQLPLDEDIETDICTEYGTHHMVVSGGEVRITSAPCPDLICVHHTPVSRVGESIVCLPCRLVVTVTDRDTVLWSPSETQETGGEGIP